MVFKITKRLIVFNKQISDLRISLSAFLNHNTRNENLQNRKCSGFIKSTILSAAFAKN